MKLNYFLISCKLWTLHVLPLGCDMWLPYNYPARYYSLCDIGILAPVFVIVMSSGFVSAYEFQLCVSRLVPALCWRLSCGLGLDFLVLKQCFNIAHSIYYVVSYWDILISIYLCSFMLRYFEKALCYVVSSILVMSLLILNF